MGVPRHDDNDPSTTLLHCFLAEGTCGGIGLIGTSSALETFADRSAPSSGETVGQRAPTSPLTVSS